MKHYTTADIREEFKRLLAEQKFTSVNREASMTHLTGNTTIEIVGASFIADEESIFGEVNWEYVQREEEWYNSMSLNVNDIPGGAPKIWAAVADKDGFVNSNYGYLLFSDKNFSQYENAKNELLKNPESRRANTVYTRPSMWIDYNMNGRSDFCCTESVQYLIRDGAVHAVVRMRSNDTIFGYRNDRAWQKHILEKLTADLNAAGNDYCVGKITWQVGSLHIYSRHYYLVDHFAQTGKIHISKEQYKEIYPDSSFK